MLNAAEVLPQLFLSGERHARIGVAELAVVQFAGAHQVGAINAHAAGGMQHCQSDAGANRGVE